MHKPVKTCPKCRELKPIHDFYSSTSHCKLCKKAAYQAADVEAVKDRKEKAKAYYIANKETLNEYAVKYKEANYDELKRYKKAYQLKNKVKLSEVSTKYAKLHPEQCKATAKKYYRANLEKEKIRSKKYQLANREKIKVQSAVREKANRCVRNEAYRDRIKNLAPCYIAELIGIPTKNIPIEILEAKRLHLRLMRLIKEKRNEINE